MLEPHGPSPSDLWQSVLDRSTVSSDETARCTRGATLCGMLRRLVGIPRCRDAISHHAQQGTSLHAQQELPSMHSRNLLPRTAGTSFHAQQGAPSRTAGSLFTHSREHSAHRRAAHAPPCLRRGPPLVHADHPVCAEDHHPCMPALLSAQRCCSPCMTVLSAQRCCSPCMTGGYSAQRCCSPCMTGRTLRRGAALRA